MLVEIPRGKGRGTWQRVLFHTPEPEYRPFWSAIVVCPECGKLLNAVNHTIAPDGQVTPSLGHPAEYPPCGWHTNPKLLGWEQWPVPENGPAFVCARCGAQAHGLGGWGTWSGGGDICAECVLALKPHNDPNSGAARGPIAGGPLE